MAHTDCSDARTTTSFVYNGDGKLMKQVTPDGTSTIYIGQWYEESQSMSRGRVRTNYYYLGGQRVALRRGGVVNWLHADHLGSVSETTSATGGRIAQERYYPYGRVRWGSAPTSYNFTGQRLDPSTGLLFFQARYYDPYLNRWIQPDSIVPNLGNPQSSNRFTYSYNNPLKYTDPSGHCAVDANGNIAVDDQGHLIKTDCTVDDFLALTWAQRLQWLQRFVAQYKLGDWFKDIEGAIGEYFPNDSQFSDLNGWASYMDAAVLQAINDGMRLANGQAAIGFGGSNGGAGWATFFRNLQTGAYASDSAAIIDRLLAEQQGVDYAKNLPESQRRYNAASELEQIHIDVFLSGADTYRSAAWSVRPGCDTWLGGCPPISDPRTSWQYLSRWGSLAWPITWFLYSQLQQSRYPTYPY